MATRLVIAAAAYVISIARAGTRATVSCAMPRVAVRTVAVQTSTKRTTPCACSSKRAGFGTKKGQDLAGSAAWMRVPASSGRDPSASPCDGRAVHQQVALQLGDGVGDCI